MMPKNACPRSSTSDAHGAAALAQHHQRKAEQDGDQQHLQDIAVGKGADEAVGDDVQDELDGRLVRGAVGILGDRGRIAGGAAEPFARAREVADQKADGQRQRRHDLEVDERLDADAADLARVLDVGDAGDDGAEDDRRDGHLDQLDEAVAERLHPRALGDVGRQPADQEAEHDGDQHLHVEELVERLVRHLGAVSGSRLSHDVPPGSRFYRDLINSPAGPQSPWSCCGRGGRMHVLRPYTNADDARRDPLQ